MEQPENYIGNHEEEESTEYVDTDFRDESGEYDALTVARSAYESSTDYFDANIRTQIEKNLAMFRSAHHPGSKYHTEDYKYRSKLFRPKTRASERRAEAAAAVAFFSTADSVSIKAENESDGNAVKGADIMQNLVTHRLEHNIPWFQTVIGGFQDASNTGIVISRQEWIYEVREVKQPEAEVDPESMEAGSLIEPPEPQYQVVEDRPDMVLIPVENFRFDPASDWRDPVKSSPYLIELIPMYVYKIKERMRGENLKTGEEAWNYYSDTEILSAKNTGESDSTRLVREGNRQDSTDVTNHLSMYEIAWVHRNICNLDGEDVIFYTLGTEYLLSEPKPLRDVYFHGRPYVVGTTNIETHKVYPSGEPELTQDLQVEANDVANQRLDNVKLALNKRYRAKRGSNTDWNALKRSTPGGIILMDRLDDVIEEKFTDVTASSYQEQDRINTDFDELSGTFSSSSVQSNRSMNETVGGMSMALDDSNVMTEYKLRTFVETWMEKVIKQLVVMEQMYETDARIMTIAGEGMPPDQVEQLLLQKFVTRVSVGFGATAPHKRIEKLAVGLRTILEFQPQLAQSLNGEEILAEVFGALGFRDSSRFISMDEQEDPRVQELTQQLQELQKIIETKQTEVQGRLQVEQTRQQGALQRDQLKLNHSMQQAATKGQLEYITRELAAETNDIKRGELILQKQALEWQMKNDEINMLTQERDKLSQRSVDDDERQYKRKQEQMTPEADGGRGDGLQDGRGSTAIKNDNYGKVPMAEG